MPENRRFEAPLLAFCRSIQRRVRRGLARGGPLAAPEGRSAGDVQYGIDRLSEDGLVALAGRVLKDLRPFRLLTEGLPPEGVVVGRGAPRRRVIVDPIDGTRGLMYGKRSAFVLAGVARETPAPRFRDLVTCVLTEIPPPGSGRAFDAAVATRGRGARVWREPAARGSKARSVLRPSRATTLAHGFATFNRFLDGAQDAIGALAEDFFDRALKEDERGHVFEDQFISNGGQMHGLLVGRDRFVADLRPLFKGRRGRRLAASHPYDLLAALILEEAGCPVTDERGRPLDPPLDVTTDVAWVGYANAALRRKYEGALLASLSRHKQRQSVRA
jgi:fructose-1,6-bisphosphatase/inositol monophosphatase family enzyme